MQVLTFTSLYPNSIAPRHGIFVETRLAAIQRVASVEACVIAPVPWFPSRHPRFGRYADYARVPPTETRLGNRVFHPRYWTLPGVGMYIQPIAMAAAASRLARELCRTGFDFDVLDAHYFYPDGVAAALLARRMQKPLVVTARGSDINLLARHPWPRHMIKWAAREAAAIVTVSEALSARLIELGVDAARIAVVRNGVDTERFAPVDRHAARQRLGLPAGPLIVSIGNLVPEKGHMLLVDALRELADVRLVIVGDGPERARIEQRIATNRLGSRVTVLPAQQQQDLKWIYGAADVTVLASSREGLPNVLLESLACGTPVVATRVGGVREIVTDSVAGRMVNERSPAAVARVVHELLSDPPSRVATRAFAARFDWATAARAHVAAFERAIAIHSPPRTGVRARIIAPEDRVGAPPRARRESRHA
jgi:teichuronic acid biosynthesis glycosyltransferase TuaC